MDARTRGHVCRTNSDPEGKVKARALHGDDQALVPQYLLFHGTNVPINVDDKGGGTKRRTWILDMPHDFVDCREAPNERQKDSGLNLGQVPGGDDRNCGEWIALFFFSGLASRISLKRNASCFVVVLQVYRILLSAKKPTPIPLHVQVAELQEFVVNCLRPTDRVAQAKCARPSSTRVTTFSKSARSSSSSP